LDVTHVPDDASGIVSQAGREFHPPPSRSSEGKTKITPVRSQSPGTCWDISSKYPAKEVYPANKPFAGFKNFPSQRTIILVATREKRGNILKSFRQAIEVFAPNSGREWKLGAFASRRTLSWSLEYGPNFEKAAPTRRALS